jgi:pseudaminic acid cytidylyltransferase
MSITHNNLCIIPARGGSKRIPKKNIKDFFGKPIISYSIEAALDTGLFSEVMVSTDDEEIAAVAKLYGAEVPFFRSKKTADDFATLSDVIEEVKQSYLDKGKVFDNICCLLPTAPFVSSNLLRELYYLMVNQGFDSVRPIVRFGFPIQRALKKIGDRVEMFNPQFLRTRSQDLEPCYHDAGMFYWMTYKAGLTGESKGALEIPEKIAQDIDTLEDWDLAEIKFRYLLSKNEL